MPEGRPLDPRNPGADRPVEPETQRLKDALKLDPRNAPEEADARGYGPIMTAARFADRFRFYDDQPQQARGVWILYDEIMALEGGRAILSEDSNWATEFSSAPPPPPKPVHSNPLVVPFQSQLDNSSGQGHRECFSSSCAMAAMFWGKIENDDAYNLVRARFGDTTDASAQVATLRHLGLQADFIQNGTVQWLENQIKDGKPTPVGWLHHSHVSAPSGGGHWTITVGFTDTHWIQNDPFGVADMVNGGYTADTNGKGVRYTRQNWDRRWLVYSSNDGWAMDIRP
jgi:hypothetical protein